MILLVHKNALRIIKVLHGKDPITINTTSCSRALFELGKKFPEEVIGWCEERYLENINLKGWKELFSHELIMASYAVGTKFLDENIGYIDQMPFINIKRNVRYPTWQMSSDVGGVVGKTLVNFKPLFNELNNFDYLLNSIAKVGQQNGLFCYSDPGLLKAAVENEPVATAGKKDLFSFVYQHYKTIWIFVLFFCITKYEKRFPIFSILRSLFYTKFYRKELDLLGIGKQVGTVKEDLPYSIDVIIPTIDRPEYVKQVVEDLSNQSLYPKKVILVEQQPDQNSTTELQDLFAKAWPFKLVHILTHKTGACMARNKALEKIESEWVFFADDDIRLAKEVLADTLIEASRLGVNCINLNCKQPGEETIFHKVKQWGSFGSGTSVVRSKYAKHIRFSEVFEHGYGEDADYGMKLREAGCDIIYHSDLEILHLKAPVGGFRKKPVLEWEKENPQPKPSPTLMILAKRYYTPRQIKGFKISLYLKFFRKQKEKNPFTYLRNMEKSWKKSEEWAKKLEAQAALSREFGQHKRKSE